MLSLVILPSGGLTSLLAGLSRLNLAFMLPTFIRSLLLSLIEAR